MGAVASTVGIMGMAGMVGSSGYNATVSSDKIRDAIASVKVQTADWQKKYTDVINAEYVLDAAIQGEIIQSLDTYITLKATIQLEKDNYNAEYKKIQIVGIVFITIIFFLLLLKQFGLFQSLWETLTFPERWAWDVIFGKSGKEKA